MALIKFAAGFALCFWLSFVKGTFPTRTLTQGFPVEAVAVQTAAAALPKRDNQPTSLCGYFSEAGSSLTCATSNYCGFNSQSELFGCCTSASLDNGDYSLYGCWQPSTCYQAIETLSSNNCANDWVCCDTFCQNDASALYCTDATAPACVQYQISYPGIVYSNYGCSNTNGLFDLYASAAVTGTTTLEGFGSSVSLESSVQVDTEITAVQPQPTTTISSFIAPTETQKTLGEEPTTPILPSSTAQIARGSLATPTWRPENIVILLILQLLFVI